MTTGREIANSLEFADDSLKEAEEHLQFIPTNDADLMGFKEELESTLAAIQETRSWISKVLDGEEV